jgi:hypothetical protein
MKGESISRILFSPDPSFQKEGNGIRLPTRNPDEPQIEMARLLGSDEENNKIRRDQKLGTRKKVGVRKRRG